MPLTWSISSDASDGAMPSSARRPLLDATHRSARAERAADVAAGVAHDDVDDLQAVQVQADALGDALMLAEGQFVVIVLDEQEELFGRRRAQLADACAEEHLVARLGVDFDDLDFAGGVRTGGKLGLAWSARFR
ncbi:MAG: hypothetical protein IPO59_14715 [Betaproteobacteria bacterium]|nr:hypothetical protein [Betaproteobacteria bacterium]